MQSISEKRFGSDRQSSDLGKSETGRLEYFRADGTPGPIAWQSTTDRRSKALRSFVSLSLRGAAGRQQPFHLKERVPFSWVKRAHHLF